MAALIFSVGKSNVRDEGRRGEEWHATPSCKALSCRNAPSPERPEAFPGSSLAGQLRFNVARRFPLRPGTKKLDLRKRLR
ncbi:MAG: hypothetical protein DRH20_07095 [Deltaproteobacteria bacterium]|nr:MAG: hypothetical protein DRH20_07095 [Deltaproteobacteria bacterium]